MRPSAPRLAQHDGLHGAGFLLTTWPLYVLMTWSKQLCPPATR